MIRFHKILILILLFSASIYGQIEEELFTLYHSNQFQELKQKLETDKSKINSSTLSFYQTLFEEDANKAKENYKFLFKNTTGRIQYLSAEKLMQFHYAGGYYKTAEDYQKFLVENRELFEKTNNENNNIIETAEQNSSDDNEKFYIQVAAFSVLDNASQMKQMLNTQDVQSFIKERVVNNRTLYCVWVPGKTDFKETLDYANSLKKKYQLEFRIIKE